MKVKINMNFKNFKIIAIIFSLAFPAVAQVFSERPEVKQFIEQMVVKHGFKQQELIGLFNNFTSSKEIIQKISHPYEEMNWQQYRKVFINQERISQGVKFWQQYAKVLQQAEQQFGVPAEIIVAILGVETLYGKNLGNYPVLQALATLAFDYPKRSAFFLAELEQYLLLTREQKLPAALLKGSYAGAMGTPQFIASSYRNFAIDFAKIGQVDLINNIPNAIGSVANYFKMHGWQPKQPVAHKVIFKNAISQVLPLAELKNPKPTLLLSSLQPYKLKILEQTTIKSNTPIALIQLGSGQQAEYWLGRENFYVITRYNHSSNYAMAVYELSQNIAKEFRQSF